MLRKMALKYIIFIVFVGAVCAQTDNSLSEAMSNLPPELQGKVDEKQVTELKNKTGQMFKKKCEENSGPDAFTKAEKAFGQFSECLKNLVDPQKVQQEIEDAKPNGQVDEVFKKYCQKTPEFKSCFKDMMESVKPCFQEDEQKNIKTVYNMTEQLAEFVCFKEGDRIALFIAENGPQCFQEKQAEVEQCLNKTLGAEFRFNQDNISMENFSLPKITFGDKECNQLTELQQCVVSALETCSAPTSANIVESLFKFARRATPCKEIPESDEVDAMSGKSDATEKQQHNTASSLVTKSFAMAAIVLTLLV